jgi:periplasmic protein TonB
VGQALNAQLSKKLQHPATITAAVLLLHGAGLWALQSGLLVRALEAVVPAELISEVIEPPKPELPKPELPKPTEKPLEPIKQKVQAPPPAPLPLAIADPMPAPNAPIVSAAVAAPLPPIAAPVSPAPMPATPSPPPPAPPAAAPAPKLELPRSDADYLNNPTPAYPPVSRRMGEQGRAVLRVRVSVDGGVESVELRSSSGSERLDAAAIAAVQRWRFKPGTRGGVAEAMWAVVPIDFKLD